MGERPGRRPGGVHQTVSERGLGDVARMSKKERKEIRSSLGPGYLGGGRVKTAMKLAGGFGQT